MFKISPEKFFVYCALIFGILFVTIIPPFQSPDEDSHFKKAYVTSKGQFFPTSRDGIVGYEIPTDMIGYINEKLTFIGNRDKKYTYSEEVLDDKLPKDYSNVTFHNFSTAETTPIVYLAPAMGIVFSKIATKIIGMDNISITVMLHFARFFSLLLYISLVYLAIKMTPILKKTFCIIGLLPMSLSLAAAISHDSVLIAISILCTALIFKLIFDDSVKKISYKYLIVFGIIGFILLSVKTLYVTLLLPLIFIPKEKYEGKVTNIIKYFAIMIGIAIVLFILNKLPSLFLQKNSTETMAGEQLNYVLSNPVNYLKIWIKAMWNGRSFYYPGMIGIFGLIDTYMPTIYTIIYSVGGLAIILSDLSLCPTKFNWKYKCVSILGCIATVFGIFTVMYILWTSMELGVKGDIISGVQGRYFIPLIPLGVIVLSNSFLRKNEKIKLYMGKILSNSYFVPIMMLTVSTLTIFLRYWC